MRTSVRRTTPGISSLTRLIAVFALILGSAVANGAAASSSEPPPTIASDKADYAPGSTVNLAGAGWAGDTSVHISVNDTLGKSWQREVDVAVDGNGHISDSFVLPSTFVAEYDVLATGQQTGRTATTTFTDASADIDQCANGGVGNTPESCNNTYPANWVNGNLGASKSHFAEGESIPYRIKMAGLVDNSTDNRIIFAWDVTKDSKHAIDYLTSFDETVTDANPCTSVAGCSLASETNFTIPQDSTIPFTQIAGSFSMFGGAITGVAGGDYGFNPGNDDCPAGSPDFVGTDTRCIELIFTATETNPVLAWGGHIASRQNWGAGNAAVNIPGSPFHTSLVALNGSGGNQDRSLSNDAVTFPATIKIIKHTVPPSSTSFGFTGSPSPVGNFSLTDNSAVNDAEQTFNLPLETQFTSYTIAENAAPGYALSSISCLVTDPNGGSSTTSLANRNVIINIKEGESRTCTFTNDLQTGTLTVIKHVVNDDGGGALAGAWSLHVKSGASEVTGSPQAGTEAGTTYTLNAGTYDVSETGGPSGYGFDGFTGDCSSLGSVTVVAGQNKTCTLTNNDNVPQLKLVKTVTNDDGGGAVPNDWSLSATAAAPNDGRNFNNLGGSGVFQNVFAGVAYTLAETPNPGTGYSSDGTWSCPGGTMSAGNTVVTVTLGASVTCTIINTDNTPQLKLVKSVVNNDGGTSQPDAWNLSATAAAPKDGRNFSNAGGSGVFHDVFAGAEYTLAESPNAGTGYSSTGEWSCPGGTLNAAKNVVTVPLGGVVTCTITNTDDTPQLKLVKSVINDDGGTNQPDAWNLSATAAAPNDGRNFNNAGGSGVLTNVFGGVEYTLAENPNPGTGYSSSGEWSCPGGSLNAAKNVVTVPLGASVTCTIINTDNTPQLKLVKSVVNNDGGTSQPDAWNLSATAAAPNDGRNFSNAGGSGVPTNVFANTAYTLAENPNPGTGYSSTGQWSCPGGVMSAGNTVVTVPLGASVTCTIVNTDDTPQLKLVKSVLNNDGGTATPDSWVLSANAAAPDNGRNFSNLGGSGVFQNVFAGAAYTLTENPNPGAGYSSTGQWSCPGGVMSAGNTVVTVPLGASVTCTIVNTDNTPQLKLVKSVLNNDGGTSQPDAWNLSATAAAPNDGRNFNNAGGSGVLTNVFGGVEYTLAENPNPGTGYSSTGQWSCPGGVMSAGNTVVSVPLGASVTCTIVNTDDTPQLKLVKVATNNDGGTNQPDAWNLSATAAAPNDGRNFNNAGGSGVLTNVFGGVEYTLAENPNPGTGYSSTGQWSCPGGVMSAGNTVVTVPLGAHVTCTITNTDDTPQLKLVKSVLNDDGGQKVPNDWNLSATAAAPNDGRNFNNAGGSGVLTNVFGGVEYTLAENPNPGTGYSSSGEWSCPGGSLNAAKNVVTVPLGAHVTCTITNADQTPQLKLVKSVLNNDGGSNQPDAWNLSATAAAPNDGRNFNNAGGSGVLTNVYGGVEYTLAENPNPGTGYASTGQWSCPGGVMSAGNTVVVVPLGASVTCTITNTDNTPQLKLVKSVLNNDGGTATPDSWVLSANAAAPNNGRNFSNLGGSGAFQNVFGGAAYTLTENPNPGAGYSSTGQWSCPGGVMSAGNTVVTVPLGASVTCTIVNTDNTPQLKLVKSVLNNDGGTSQPDAWNLSATAAAPNDGRNFNNDGGSGAFQNVFANAEYTLAENPNPGTGYSSTGQWSCPGGVMSAGNTVVTVPLGAQVTCTIVNTDNTPQLKLVKYVANNDGGTNTANSWTLSATAAAPNDTRNFSNLGGSGVLTNVFAGAEYTLAESPNPGTGYSSTGQWSCPGGTLNAAKNVVTVPLGAQVTCTITNTDNTPTLKLVKSVSGGSATPNSFTLYANAPAPKDTRNFSNLGGSGGFQNVFANATYTLSETGPLGYTASAWSCDGGTMSANNTAVTLALGAAVTCTITNTRDLGSIQVIKYHDLNGDGDWESGADPKLQGWTMFVDLNKSGTYTPGEPTGSTDLFGSVTFSGLETNVGTTYWVCEVQQAGWVNSDPGAATVSALSPCESTTVAKNATSQVVLGNFQRIKIQVNKTLDQLPVPAGITFQFSIRKDASTNPNGVNGGAGTVIASASIIGPDNTITSAEWATAQGQQYPLNPGTYQLCEAIVEGYTPSWIQGVYGVDWFSPGIQAGAGFQETENTLVCINFTVVSGDGGADHTVEFNVDNITRGFSHTIGFWKNWTSCDGSGNQFAMLDLMISGGTRNGITYAGADDSNGNGLRDIRIGNLYIEGPNACKIAVDLLDKRPVGDPAKVRDKAKASSDPVYNSVSQLVAFELNQLLNATGTGSAACQAKAANAARLMQRFLTYINFRMTANNSTYTMPSNKTQVKQIQANLLYLANVIDDYNNNTIGGCAAALALPYPTVAGTSPLQTWGAFLPAYTDT